MTGDFKENDGLFQKRMIACCEWNTAFLLTEMLDRYE
jgi:hypothetical protein